MESNKPPFVIEMRGYTFPELAKLYKVSEKTFRRWLKPFKEKIGVRQGRYYNVAQVNTIISNLGIPNNSAQTGNVGEN